MLGCSVPPWETRLQAGRPGWVETPAASLELFPHGVRELDDHVGPSSYEEPRPGCKVLLDMGVCGGLASQIKVISEEVTSPSWVPFSAVSGQAQGIRLLGQEGRVPEGNCFPEERKSMFMEFLCNAWSNQRTLEASLR